MSPFSVLFWSLAKPVMLRMGALIFQRSWIQ